MNLQLRPRLLALTPGTRIVSHDWDLGDWQPDRSITLDVADKAIGRDQRSTVHLSVVPAQVHGLWCSAGATLALTQRFQPFSAVLNTQAAARVAVFDTRVGADELVADGSRTGTGARLRLAGPRLLPREATGGLAGAVRGPRLHPRRRTGLPQRTRRRALAFTPSLAAKPGCR